MQHDSPMALEPRLFRSIFDQSSDPMVIIDDAGRVLALNGAARALDCAELEQVFASQRDKSVTSIRAQLRIAGRATGEIQLPSKSGPGRRFAVEAYAQAPHYALVLRDVSERRHLEDEIRHLRRLEAVGLVTSSVVHDFNNVLTAIVCASALLAREVEGQERAASLAREIQSAGGRAATLVRQVLRLLRREASVPGRVNLSYAVSEMRGLVELVVGREVELVLDLSPDVGDTLVDREQLDQLLLNLAANARDAMPRGGRLSIATANVAVGDASAVGAECAAEGAYVVLTVTDTGAGMAPEVRERVFERFFTTKDAASGTGLGLSTAQRFVKASGGCISLRSAPGEGTAVLVYLPRLAPSPEVISPRAYEDDGPRGTETIVVIDPDNQVRTVIAATLGERGYSVIHAPSAESALGVALASPDSVDLVLSDVVVPGGGGVGAVLALRDHGHAPALLWMTGLPDRALSDRGLEGQLTLRKAFSPAELARRVREALDARVVMS